MEKNDFFCSNCNWNISFNYTTIETKKTWGGKKVDVKRAKNRCITFFQGSLICSKCINMVKQQAINQQKK